jgi:lysophospholipase L1-like esterase
MIESIGRSERQLRLAFLLALAILGAVFALGAQAAQAANYVGLGDSYTAGPLIPNQLPPYGCLKSDHNFPHLAAGGIGLELRDPSCSGAETEDMTQTQNVEPGPNPPQFDSLDANTEVVSITIGGNDIGFSEILQSCITVNPFSHPCIDKYRAGGVDQLAQRIEATAPLVATVLQGIHSRAPNADVYLLNYAAVFPETGYGCWPQMPVGFLDVPYLRATQKRLNSMLAAEASANGATLVDWYSASIGHDACKSVLNRWVEPLVPNTPAAPVHPNLAGMQGAANVLLAAVG